jgi:tetratricopeptide (TPR) repeat protein
VLAINPGNQKIRTYLEQLRQQSRPPAGEAPQTLLAQAQAMLARGDAPAALDLARRAVNIDDRLEAGWLLVGDLSPGMAEQTAAFRKALAINPANREARARLEALVRFKDDPMALAARLEADGRFDQAIRLYAEAARNARDPREFDRISRAIAHLETLRKEQIRHVSPAANLVRMTFGWFLLYLLLFLLQSGLNPIAHPEWLLCLGMPLVAAGGFLLALAELGARHPAWQKYFAGRDATSWGVRIAAGALGWTLIFVPHVLVVVSGLQRLADLQVPPPPIF